jgi:multicomponent K+:H+ antiporter subunit A
MPDGVLLVSLLLASWAGTALPLLPGSRRGAALASAAVMALCLILLLSLAPAALAGQVLVAGIPWLPQLGLNLTLRLDGLGLLFGLLILGIGLLVVLYAYYYLPAKDTLARFYTLLLMFMAAMLGVVLSENLLLLVLFWEITSLASFLLIGYKKNLPDARIAARLALAVTGGGGLALLAGVLLLGEAAGSYELSQVLAAGDRVRAHEHYGLMLALVLLGAFTKSALFPFHFWLPGAMAAPTPVSAYLHSATMVKAGVFLLARLHPALAGTDGWFYAVGGAGAATLVYAAYIALHKHDFKGLLAYSTVSHLGLIALLLGLDTPLSTVAAVFHIINHAIFKASLFMAAGIVDHECGTRDMRRVNGLFRRMPVTATLAIVAAGSMAGVPLLNGFLSKEMFFAETVGHPAFQEHAWILPLFATVAGMLAVAYSSRFIHDVFFNGEPVNLPRQPHEPPRWMRAPVEVLVTLCLLVGMAPAWSVAPLLAAAAGATLQAPLPEYELALWHGVNAPFLMSLAALAGGVVLYSLRHHLFRLHDRLPPIRARLAFERLYNRTADLSRILLDRTGHDTPRHYLMWLLLFALIYGGWAVFTAHAPLPLPAWSAPDPVAWSGLAVLALAALGATVLHRQRLLALLFTGVAGLMTALAFVRFSAPDLALTQLAVEVVTLVLLLLALYFLPQQPAEDEPRVRRFADAALATLAGLAMAAAAWVMLATDPRVSIAGFFLDQAVPGGGGSNVVNVILVDFRGFDTFGEITVLAMAALGVQALLDRLLVYPPAQDASGRPWDSDRHPLVLSMLMRPLLPLALAVALYLFLRGHNLPGGGFVAGLVAAVALILQYLASGAHFAALRLPRPEPFLALGLLLAAGTGLASLLFGRPFLTSAHGQVSLPWLGDLPLASALVFDLGVFFVVVATVLTILTALGRLAQVGRVAPEDAP